MTNEDKMYEIYLNTFAIVRSGGELGSAGSLTLAEMAARAMAATDASDQDFMPAPKWVMLADVDRLLNSKRPEENACKVVPMGEKP